MPLDDVRVLELGAGVGVAYAGKLLREMGADVLKVAPPPFAVPAVSEQDRVAVGLFGYLNSGKRVLPAAVEAHEELVGSLAESADVVIHDFGASTPLRRLVEDGVRTAPRIVCAITPFGGSSRYQEYAATELIVDAASGYAYVHGADPRSDQQVPLRHFGSQSGFHGGTYAAMAVLASLLDWLRAGQGRQIDVSRTAAMTLAAGLSVTIQSYTNVIASRNGARSFHPWCLMPCQDGYLQVIAFEDEQWRALMELLGDPEWGTEPLFANAFLRAEHWAALLPLLEGEVAKHRVADLFYPGQAAGVPLAPVSTMADLFASPQLEARQYFQGLVLPEGERAVVPGPSAVLSLTPPPPPAFPRVLGEDERPFIAPGLPRGGPVETVASGDDVARGPLAGIRVVDLTHVWAGPLCGMFLAQLGADVIKVESTARLDVGRRYPPFAEGVVGPNRSGYFNQSNMGKRSISIDLRHPEGRSLVCDLVASSHAVIENFSTGTMERLGLGYDELRTINPSLVYASITGFGVTGPWANFVSYGPSQEAVSGICSLHGYEEGPPGDLGLSYGDPTAAVHGAVAVVAALLHRERTGEGQRVDVSMHEALIRCIPEGVLSQSLLGTQPPRMGNRDPVMAPHGVFPAAGDDAWVAIAVRTDEEFARLAGLTGLAELAAPEFATLRGRKAGEAHLEAIVAGWTATLDRFEVARRLQAAGIPAFPCLNAADLAADARDGERSSVLLADHREVGVRAVPAIPFQFSPALSHGSQIAPLLGEHTDAVLAEVLGMGHQELRRLREAGALR